MDPTFVDGGTLAPSLPCCSALDGPAWIKMKPIFSHRGSHCAICWVKHTGPLLECHDAVCLERDKSLQAVTRAVLWHYSQQRGTPLMLTNTGERGSFTTHPLSRCQYSTGSRRLSLSQGHVCIQLPNMKSYRCWIHTFTNINSDTVDWFGFIHPFIRHVTEIKMTMVHPKTTPSPRGVSLPH